MPVTVASVPVFVLPPVLLLSCSIVIYYILWCKLLLLVSHGVILLLLPRIDIISHTIIYYLLPSNSPQKTANLVKLFSAPLVPCPHPPWCLRMHFASI